MNTKRMDGNLFEQMMRNGLNNLALAEKEINALNVFPVADGDTGTNMRMTLENGLRCAGSVQALNDYLKAFSGGMLLGARGNSGVILSQIFKGIYLELSRTAAATPTEFRNALIRGYRVAYESVIKPVEGTILTVAREGIEQTKRLQRNPNDMESLLRAYLAAMEVSLEATPQLLPILAEMGVIDSGGKGYIAIVEGMYKWLLGEKVERVETMAEQHSAPAQPDFSEAALTALRDGAFEEGYCMEFILQRMRASEYQQDFSEKMFIRDLGRLGESLVVVQDGDRVKVHVHTHRPSPVIELAQRYGEFITFKLENMQLQHHEYLRQKDQPMPAQTPGPKTREKKPLAVITVVNGEANRQLFLDLGCDMVLDGGPTMNTSSQEFMDAIRELNADRIVILPNGANMQMAARQAVELMDAEHVQVLSSRSLPEGYCAMAMDIPDSPDTEARIAQMQEGIESVQTLLITTASRSYSNHGVHCEDQEYIALFRDELVFASDSAWDTLKGALQKIEDLPEKETCVFFRGEKGDRELESRIEAYFQENYPLIECVFLEGGQEIYDWVIGLM